MVELRHLRRRIEYWLKAGRRTDDGVADDGRDQPGHERFDLEVFFVKNFRGDNGAGERGFKNGGDACAESGGQGDVAFAGGEFEQICDAGSGSCADLGDGTFTAGSQAAA